MTKSRFLFNKFAGLAMGGVILLSTSIASANKDTCKPADKNLPSTSATCTDGTTPALAYLPKPLFASDIVQVHCGGGKLQETKAVGGYAQCIVEKGSTVTIHYKPVQ